MQPSRQKVARETCYKVRISHGIAISFCFIYIYIYIYSVLSFLLLLFLSMFHGSSDAPDERSQAQVHELFTNNACI